ncbi:MAG: TonB family protein [Mediterranea sp.]|jgi:TonB family protein|nr:TonB family protein [Mediterranea sp.]
MKKTLCIVITLLIATHSWAQKKIYLTKDGEYGKADEASAYVIITDEDGKGQKVETYSMGDTLKSITYYSKFGKERNKRVRDGVSTYYYKDGTVRSVDTFANNHREGESKVFYPSGALKLDANYKGGLLNDSLTLYYPNGKIRRKEVYQSNKCISGKLWDEEGNELPFNPYFILPQFPGGIEKCKEVMEQLLKYPKDLRKKGVQGRVILRFIVDQKGKMSDIEVIKTTDYLLNEPAIQTLEAIGLMYYWIPGKVEGEPIRTAFTIPVNFRLT